MDDQPKLFPIWHDIGLQHFMKQSSFNVSSSEKLPDHGGIGVDVCCSDQNLHCENPKFTKCETNFKANRCSLPFLLNEKIKCYEDPCVEPIKEQKRNYDAFCSTLREYRSRRNAIRKKFLSLQQNITKARNEKKSTNLRVNKRLLDLANKIPQKPVFSDLNLSYAGGTLESCKSLENPLLLHANSNDYRLYVTPLKNGTDSLFSPISSEQCPIPLKKEPIFQIESVQNDFCCVRQKSHFSLVKISSKESYFKHEKHSELLYIAASPYNPSEILSVYENGRLKLRDMENRKTVWNIMNNDYADQFLMSVFWTCSFGSHPFSALCLNEKRLYSYDLRAKDYDKRLLFSIENPSCYINEALCVLKGLKTNLFQHLIASNYHVVVCDERYPKQPVMYWNHMLQSNPLYCDILNLEDCDYSLALLGTQNSKEIVALALKLEAGKIHPLSLNPPLLLSCPTDCVESLKLHCIPVSESISKRFSCSLSGITIIPHFDKTSFSVFQSTSIGDVFCQDYTRGFEENIEKTYHVGTGCVLTPPEKILKSVNLQDSLTFDTAEIRRDNLDSLKVDISQCLDFPKEISASCSLCRLSKISEKKTLVFEDICATCGLNSNQSQHLSSAYASSSILIGCYPEKPCSFSYDVSDLAKFSDEYSKRILSVWTESDDVNFESNDLSVMKEEKSTASVPAPSEINNLPTTIHSSNTFDTGIITLSNTFLNENEIQEYSYIDSQDTLEDIVPPSQNVKPRLGETIHASNKAKFQKLKKNITAGF